MKTSTYLLIRDDEKPQRNAKNAYLCATRSPTSMDHFDQNGNVMWSVPGFTPVIATADGGVIARSPTGQYVTFDQNGVADGMMASMPKDSWTGEWYSASSTDMIQTLLPPVDFDASFSAQGGGNPTGNGTSVHSIQKMYRSQIASIAQGYATDASTLWVPYNVSNYTGQRSPSVKSYIKDTCNIFVGDVLSMAQRAVLNQLIGNKSYVPSPFDLSSPLPFAPIPVTADMSVPEFYHVSTLYPDQTGWVYIGSRDWATWLFYYNQPYPPPGQGPVSGQVSGGAGCWVPVPGGPASAQPGDVMAEYAYGGRVHHTAINVVPGPSGQVASTSGIGQTYSDTVVQSNWGYRTTVAPPYYIHGLEQDVVARRWSCY